MEFSEFIGYEIISFTEPQSSKWVSCVQSRGSLLNINSNNHNVSITVNYIQLCSFIFRSEIYLLLTLYPQFQAIWNGHLFVSESENKEIAFIICHYLSSSSCMNSWCFVSSVIQAKKKSGASSFYLPTGEI